MDNDAQYVNDCGFLKPAYKVTMEDLTEITEVVCIEFLIKKTITEIQQFEEGLNALSIGNLIQACPFYVKDLSVSQKL